MSHPDSIDALQIRARLGKKEWLPPETYGDVPGMGYRFDSRDGRRIIVTSWPEPDWGDGDDWLHASISHHDTNIMPTYEDLVLMHRAVWGTTGHAYQCFVPSDEHISIRSNVLHLWGSLYGDRQLPDFGKYGTI